MYKTFIIIASILLFASPAMGQYTDHRDHKLDSLESVVAPWTQERIASASREEKDRLTDAFEELMWGYCQINPSRSLYFARKTYTLSLQELWLNQAFQAAKMIGQHHWAAGQIDSAKANFATALSIADRMALKEPLPGKPNGYKDATIDDAYSSLYGAIGNLYSSIDSLPQAMDYYRRAGEIFEKNGWNENSSNLYHNMGETWLDAGDLKQAEPCYKKAILYGEKADDPLLIAEAKSGLGALYLEKGNTTRALQYLKEADEYFSANEDQEYRSRIYTLDLTGKVLEAQKRQRTLIATIAAIAALLLLAAIFILLKMFRTRRQLQEADVVIGEVLAEHEGNTDDEILPYAQDDKGAANHAEQGAEPSICHAERSEASVPAPELTDREASVLPLLAQGLTSKEIASKLFLTEQTIKWYRMRLLEKFKAKNTAEMLSKAREAGML